MYPTVPAAAIGKPSAAEVADGVVDADVAPDHERHRDEAAAGAHQAGDETDRAAGAEHPGASWQLARRPRLAIAQHLQRRHADEDREDDREPERRQPPGDLRPDQRSDQDARRQQPDDAPEHRAALVVCAHRRHRGEEDRRERRGDRHVDDVLGRKALPGEQRVRNGTISMPPPMPSSPAAKPVQAPSSTSAPMNTGLIEPGLSAARA